MNRRQKMKLLKQENERLKCRIRPIHYVREPLIHMSCKTCIDMRAYVMTPELAEQMVITNLCRQMNDVIKKNVIEVIDSDTLSVKEYRFDFWVKK